jgi:type I restriction enzyme R subunit
LVAEKEEVVKFAKDSGLSTRAFAVYRKLRDDEVIRNAGIAARELAQETESLLELYPDIQVDADEQRQLRASLGRLLLGLDKKERVRVVDTVLGILLDDVAKIETQGSFRDLPVNELRVAPLVLPRAS